MINEYVLAGLATERRRTLLAEADQARLAKQARPRRLGKRNPGPGPQPGPRAGSWPGSRRHPAGAGQCLDMTSGSRVLLRDGSPVVIRAVRSSDAPLLADGFSRLSEVSRRLRFLIGKDRLTDSELRFFTDVDHHDHEAIGALSPVDGRGVGVARYVRDAGDPHTAELAITVVDDWQCRGLGTELLTQLACRAGQEGIRRFTALVSADNVGVAKLLRHPAFDVELVACDPETLEYEITVA